MTRNSPTFESHAKTPDPSLPNEANHHCQLGRSRLRLRSECTWTCSIGRRSRESAITTRFFRPIGSFTLRTYYGNPPIPSYLMNTINWNQVQFFLRLSMTSSPRKFGRGRDTRRPPTPFPLPPSLQVSGALSFFLHFAKYPR